MKPIKYLDNIDSPSDLRKLRINELPALADEMRQRIIDVVSDQGGHLASNLGITDLTIALHYVFDFRSDRLLWDVGHQCYGHKLLTGRREDFPTLRQAGGISGFPAPSESEYDLFSTGHAGTAISTAVGLAWADQANKRDSYVAAVVGDASIVNGLSMEGINNTGTLNRQLLIILNDNSMAIDRTRGSLAHALDRIRTTHTYVDLKQTTKQILKDLPLGKGLAEAIRNLKDTMRTALHGEKLFEPMGIDYFGPVDGHNIRDLIWILRRLREINKPVLLHVHTQKGKGCEYAVDDPKKFHSPSAYTIKKGKAIFTKRHKPSWTQVFSNALTDLARADDDIVAITAAMPGGTGLDEFAKIFPDRMIDVGISESHAVAMAAGMAKAGKKPIVAIYSTFLQRSFDQIFHEVCLQKLPVIFCLDRSGLVGADGAVHHGLYDISFLRPLPGMVLLAPADGPELRNALKLAVSLGQPCAIRYPRELMCDDLPGPCPPFRLAESRIIRRGNKNATILCYGTTVTVALQAAELLAEKHAIDATVINARFAKPLDEKMLETILCPSNAVVICEDHAAIGGFGSAVLEFASKKGLDITGIKRIAVGDVFIPHASRQAQLSRVGLTSENIAKTLENLVQKLSSSRDDSKKQAT